ncbi:CMRF35-like molecule 3 [Anabas testudineus]|uniref:Ig-like domain-containing protein n=1 Tax=Anabas testudineus TaxID=64144 RepID=A0A3Q1HFD2_ANATE|nr:CMRF35-like molecule 3 [Anabas testudineus]
MAFPLYLLLILTGLTGIYSIITASKVTVKAGDSITTPCLYDSQYINNVKYLCKGYYWSSCIYAVRTDQPHSSSKFSISDDKMKRLVTVTIKDATDEDTGYYWCAVEINGGSDNRGLFHLSVNRDHPITPEPAHTTKDPSTVHQDSDSSYLKSFTIRLTMLLFVAVALFIWFMFLKHKQSKAESTTMTGENDMTQG